jgi:prepilin-type N-terminal cleavage/methylation domain-containing protein
MTCCRTAARRVGFTLLEVMIALAILTSGLMVLVDSQAYSVLMTHETDRLLVATMLAGEKMGELQLLTEKQGFSDQDIEESGDFSDFGAEGLLEDFQMPDLEVDLEGSLADYKWAFTLREVDISFPDMGGAGEQLASSGYWGETSDEISSSSDESSPGLADMGIDSDVITEMLSPYFREVRVRVWWGSNEDELDQVELVSHVINPSGTIIPYGSSGEATE